MRILSVSFWIGAAISLFMGFNKMYLYKNYDPSEFPMLARDNINAHVGGDAWNLVINGTHSTAYFILFGALLLAGFMVEIVITIKEAQKKDVKDLDAAREDAYITAND